MSDLALSNSLINEYLNYKFDDNFNQTKIRKLFKYIKSFGLQNNHSLMSDPAIPRALENDPLIEIIDSCNDSDLVQNTVLKLMLIDEPINPHPVYTTINILNNNEKLKLKYGATYPSAMDKNKAQKHIKALLSDASYVRIIDGYVASSRKWNDNKNLIADIIPNINIDLIIVGADKNINEYIINQSKKDELKELLLNLKEVKATQLNQNMHDRYIETDKLKILLSSGLEHLSSSLSKDFTYIVEIKNEQ